MAEQKKSGVTRRLGGASVLALLVTMVVAFTGIGTAWAVLSASFYDVVETDEWATPAPGPSGITHFTPHNTMIVVDTDANNYWDDDTGIDVWEMNLDGTVVRAWSTGFEAGAAEPTGVNYAVELNVLFITNDDGEYYIFAPGSDGDFGTGDDPEPDGPLTVAGSGDLEDPVYDPVSNSLFVLDGGGSIYRVNPTTGAVQDTIDLDLGPTNWEGLAMTPAGELLVGANVGQQIFIIDTNGNELQAAINVDSISGGGSNLALVSGMGISTPGVGGSAYDIWIADRQSTSNSNDPGDVDGRVWRLSTNGTPPPTTTTSSTSTTTTQPTTTTTAATTTTTRATTTTTTSSTTTTSQGSTTTTTASGGSTTTTTIPGGTTTTTVPNNPPTNPNPGEFSDTNGHVFENAISWLADKGITKGCNPPGNTEFCPDHFVTRGQMAAFLVRAFGYTDDGGGNLFTDDDTSVFESAIDRLRTAGITQGCNPPTNTRFCPDSLVTRGQMAAFLGRAFEYTNDGGVDWFIDDNGSVFESAIDRFRTAGVTQGCNPPLNNRYCPDDFVTRGQMATFLKRAFGE